LLFVYQAYSAQDSALIVYKHTTDKELRMLYDLLNVQYIGIECPDTNFRGKKFFLSIDEYIKGKIVKQDDLGLKEGSDTIPFTTGSGEKAYYIMNNSDHVIFPSTYKAFNLDFMSKFENDTATLKINYPGIHMTKNLACTEDFLLRVINPCGSSDSIYVQLNKATPILAFTPPFGMGGGRGNYCMLATKEVKDWYAEFKIEHFYVFNLIAK
jgi:hypothetical protein